MICLYRTAWTLPHYTLFIHGSSFILQFLSISTVQMCYQSVVTWTLYRILFKNWNHISCLQVSWHWDIFTFQLVHQLLIQQFHSGVPQVLLEEYPLVLVICYNTFWYASWSPSIWERSSDVSAYKEGVAVQEPPWPLPWLKTAAVIVLVLHCALFSLDRDCLFAFPVPFLPLCLVLLVSFSLSKVLWASDINLLWATVWHLQWFLHYRHGFYSSDCSFYCLFKTSEIIRNNFHLVPSFETKHIAMVLLIFSVVIPT